MKQSSHPFSRLCSRAAVLTGAAVLAVLVPAVPALAQPGSPAARLTTPEPDVIDIVSAMQAVTARFVGQIVAAELVRGRAGEATSAVYEFRLFTAGGDILRIRVDAIDGAILEVDGRGLVGARRPVEAP